MTWQDCYKDSYDLATPESNAHPAKMSWGLCFRIIKKLMKDNKLHYGDTVLDFMAGTGRTALCWLYLHPDNKAITVELEPHFIKMQEDNKKHLENKLGRKVNWTIIQGDSRKLSEILKEKGLVGIVSPPYLEVNQDNRQKKNDTCLRNNRLKSIGTIYSSNPSNIGNLPDKIVGIVSPPYEKSISGGKTGIEWQEEWGKQANSRQPSQNIEYSQEKENIGNQQGETYLSAMQLVFNEASKICSTLVTVTKNPTKKGKLRRLDEDTKELCKQAGYELKEHEKAILFKEVEQATLEGDTFKKPKGRLSFFKRLQYEKGNSEIAKWEDVLFFEKGRGELVGIVSPPYQDVLGCNLQNPIHPVKKRLYIISKINKEQFGQYLKEMREKKGFSKNDIDKALGTNTAYSWWEGRNYLGKFTIQLPSINLYIKLKGLLGLDERFDDLFKYEEQEREYNGKGAWNVLEKYSPNPKNIGNLPDKGI